MKPQSFLALPLLSLMLLSGIVGTLAVESSIPAKAATAQEIQSRSQISLKELRSSVPSSAAILDKAKGILIFPHAYKGGFVFAGEYGEGVLMVGEQPAEYYNLVSASWGFQAGAQRKSIVIAFMSDEALQQFRTSEGFDLGASASVTVIEGGAEGSVSLARYNKPILVFAVDQKGLMGGVSLKGSKISKISK